MVNGLQRWRHLTAEDAEYTETYARNCLTANFSNLANYGGGWGEASFIRLRFLLRRDMVAKWQHKLSLDFVRMKCIPGAVKHGNYVDLVGLDVVDDPVWSLDNLPDLIQLILWHRTPRKWRIGDLLGTASDAINHA